MWNELVKAGLANPVAAAPQPQKDIEKGLR